MTTEVLEGVIHQQYMFTIPKIIRPYFKFDRKLLGKLCLCVWETIKEFFSACLPEGVVPGAVISIQTWGNMGANLHPHLHALGSKGAFDAHGIFYPLPWIDTQKMALLFRFYGYYSNKSRGLRLKAQEKTQANQGNAAISYAPPPPKKACSKKWAELIRLVYEVDPVFMSPLFAPYENNFDHQQSACSGEDSKTS